MNLTKRQLSHTYVVVEAVDTRWGFTGFDCDPEFQFVGTRAACLDWCHHNGGDQTWEIISMEKYEERMEDSEI